MICARTKLKNGPVVILYYIDDNYYLQSKAKNKLHVVASRVVVATLLNIQTRRVIGKKLHELYSDVIGQTRIASFRSINQFAYVDITIISTTTVAPIYIYIYLNIYKSTLAVTYYFIIFETQQILHLTCRIS